MTPALAFWSVWIIFCAGVALCGGIVWALACEYFTERQTLPAWVWQMRRVTVGERVWLGLVLWNDSVQRWPWPVKQVPVREDDRPWA